MVPFFENLLTSIQCQGLVGRAEYLSQRINPPLRRSSRKASPDLLYNSFLLVKWIHHTILYAFS
jgi:hypothetical protein